MTLKLRDDFNSFAVTAMEEDTPQETVEDMGKEEVPVAIDTIVHLMEEIVVDIPMGNVALGEEDHHYNLVVVVLPMIDMVEIAVV